MAKNARAGREKEAEQATLFNGQHSPMAGGGLSSGDGTVPQAEPVGPPATVGDVRAIQDLLWKEAKWAVVATEGIDDEATFEDHLREYLPQNSRNTRARYVQTLMRWFFPDGVHGLAAQVWLAYRDEALTDEILRYLYLRAEPMAGAAVAEALLPIAENAVIPETYLPNFVRSRFGAETPAKSIQRLKANLRKLGFLVRGKGSRDTLRVPASSATGFFIVLHHLFARGQAGAVEFRTLAADPFWQYLGFKTEDQLRTILKDGLDQGLLAKYVLADRIESISFRYSFEEFIAGKMTA
jgi:hypothetical protein